MAHFAEIDKDNLVLRVLVVPDEHEARGVEFLRDDLGLGGNWVQCSYNGKLRGIFPGIGDKYDPVTDEFTRIEVEQESAT